MLLWLCGYSVVSNVEYETRSKIKFHNGVIRRISFIIEDSNLKKAMHRISFQCCSNRITYSMKHKRYTKC